eukprot:TRINITY_DN620_c0_g4_i2.p1 TRINITY_DN620_c0_g4~~TRINITY_DN620_c0_g4_i2.p1  ORF type:complete len:132 (+),score=42.13 TRINITY_DN620_c0_g4_i2:52-447(+)
MPLNKKEIFQLAKGFRGRNKNCIRIARERVEKALQYAYRDRKVKKRDWRTLWIQRVNAGVREHGMTYNQFIHGLGVSNIQLNRKILAELAVNEPYSFKSVCDTVSSITLARQIIRNTHHPILQSYVASSVH